jgi:hypothetical protein
LSVLVTYLLPMALLEDPHPLIGRFPGHRAESPIIRDRLRGPWLSYTSPQSQTLHTPLSGEQGYQPHGRSPDTIRNY